MISNIVNLHVSVIVEMECLNIYNNWNKLLDVNIGRMIDEVETVLIWMKFCLAYGPLL